VLICVFCPLVVLVRLSVPVQVIDWKDSSPRWPLTHSWRRRRWWWWWYMCVYVCVCVCVCVCSNVSGWPQWCTDRKLSSAWRNSTHDANSRCSRHRFFHYLLIVDANMTVITLNKQCMYLVNIVFMPKFSRIKCSTVEKTRLEIQVKKLYERPY